MLKLKPIKWLLLGIVTACIAACAGGSAHTSFGDVTSTASSANFSTITLKSPGPFIIAESARFTTVVSAQSSASDSRMQGEDIASADPLMAVSEDILSLAE